MAICAVSLWLAVASIGCREGASSSEYPHKPIKVIVPFGAGGDSDSFARIMQKALRDHELLPQPLVILNVPGAGGTVGSRRVRDAVPDGYTILNLHEGILTSKYSGRVPYGPEAFRPIAATGLSYLVICVRDDSPFRDLTDLLEESAKNPDTVLFGMAQGTPTHFAGLRLERAGGESKFRMVASGGGAQRSHDLLGKHIDVTPFSLVEYFAFDSAGLRAIGFLAEERLPGLPEVPTAKELGYDVVMPHVQYWWAPASTSDAVVNRIADALESAMATEYMQGKLAEARTEPFFLRGEALRAHLAESEGEFQDVALVKYEGLPDPVVPILVLTGILALFIGWRNRRADLETHTDSHWQYSLFTFAMMAGYVVAMQILGASFLWATMIFIPVLGILVGARSRSAIFRVSCLGISVSVACFLIFTKVLVIDLP